VEDVQLPEMMYSEMSILLTTRINKISAWHISFCTQQLTIYFPWKNSP